MTGVRKPTPLEAFENNMADAHQLVRLVRGFTNHRLRRMRTELRERVGEALRIPKGRLDQLDCLESEDVFAVFLPGSGLRRDDFDDPRPLLRQAVVAACAATETYVGDKVMEKIGPLLRSPETLSERLKKLPMTLEQCMRIDREYQREGWGLRLLVVEPFVRENASTAPSKIGELMSMLGIKKWAKLLDGDRHVESGRTENGLKQITERRNQIAHEADRVGRGKRAELTAEGTESMLKDLESVVRALDRVIEHELSRPRPERAV